MKYNKYTSSIEKLDISEEFKNNIIETIKKEELKKGMISMKIKNKITAIIASLGVITCGGIAYATVVPEEIRNTINNKISAFFGIETSYNEEIDYNTGLQEETLEQVFESGKENLEDYSELTDPDMYGIGDSNGGSLIETNYKQYDWKREYDEEGNPIKKAVELQEYNDIINIKLAQVNYACLQNLETENTIVDKNGHIIEIKEPTIEETLKYQYNEFKTNWNAYNISVDEEFNEQLLYFKITGMLVMNGNNLTEEDYYNNARAKKIKITFDEKEEQIVDLADTKEAQFIDLQYVDYDISKPINISVEILETYAGKESNDTYVTDIQFGISSNIPMGR